MDPRGSRIIDVLYAFTHGESSNRTILDKRDGYIPTLEQVKTTSGNYLFHSNRLISFRSVTGDVFYLYDNRDEPDRGVNRIVGNVRDYLNQKHFSRVSKNPVFIPLPKERGSDFYEDNPMLKYEKDKE